MFEAYSQSDDDLFDYDPSKESIKEEKNNASTSSSSSNIYNQISKNMENNDDDNIIGTSGLRVKFSQAVLGSYDYWVAPSGAVAYVQTINQVMDSLTGGRFSDLYLYNYLEMNILRRNNIVSLLNETFKNDHSSDSESFKHFLSKLKIDFSSSYIPTYIGTLIRISNHLIAQDRAMYLTLAEKLQLVPNPLVLENLMTPDSILVNSKVSVDNLQSELLGTKFISNINSSFVEKLNNLNQQNLEYIVRSV